MSVGNNVRLRHLLALHESGELEDARKASSSATEWARRLGMTYSALKDGLRRAQQAGHAVPRWSPQVVVAESCGDLSDVGEFDDDPTEQVEIPPAEDVPPLPVIGHGFHVKGKSTLVRPDGSIAGQWIKTAANSNAVDPVEVLRAAFGEAMPKSDPVAAPVKHADDDLLVVLPMGDPHIGMLAWEQDAGANFDLSIVERSLFSAVDQLVTLAPSAGTALIATVGDTFHSDGFSNTTTKGTRVDVDGRTPKMIATGIRVFRRVIERALEKFPRVVVKIVPGNHDALMSLVLQIALAQFYENNPRVQIDTSPEMFQWFRFGLNLIGITHGDKAKAADLMGVMAVDRAKDWGETKHRRYYCGHVHHEVIKELPGVTVEYLRTLATSDAWHRGQGYRSGQDMKMDVIHREFGLINRHVIGIEQVRRAS